MTSWMFFRGDRNECRHAKKPGTCYANGPRATACANTRAPSSTPCGHTPASTARTKRSGGSWECSTISITSVTRISAIRSHADYTGVKRESLMEHAIFATDELCGFLTACALVRPDKSFDTLEVSSVKKRMKDKAFARTVNRNDLWGGAEELGLSFDEHCAFVIASLREIQGELGLKSAFA